MNQRLLLPFLALVSGACGSMAQTSLGTELDGLEVASDDRDDRDEFDDLGETETRTETDPADRTETDPHVDPGTTDPGTDPGTTDPGTTDPGTTDPGTTDPGTEPCPAGVICVDQFPYVTQDSTTGAPSTLDAYSCSPGTDESGPEVVYQVELDEAGFLATEVYGLPAGVDVDVHILETLDADDCVDRGHWNAGALMPAGTYYVVVDSWVDGSGTAYDGDYTLGIHVTHAGDFTGYGLDHDVFERGLYAFDAAWFDGETETFVYGLIDFSMPSDQRRFFIVDLLTGDMLFDEYVAHGEGSQDPNDIRMANDFSNVSGSHMSSLGMMRAAETYYGSWGYSLRLDGLDGSYNDAVRPRAIVIHPSDYSTASFVNTYGYTGRSWGCPAVDPAISADLIDTISYGALVLTYAETNGFLSGGRFMPGF